MSPKSNLCIQMVRCDRHSKQTEQKLKTALKWKLQVGGQQLLREAPQLAWGTHTPPVRQKLEAEGPCGEAESREETPYLQVGEITKSGLTVTW